MSYTLVENFSAGVDQTRPIAVGVPGTLWEGVNGHIGRGGDFEKRRAFVHKWALPAGTFGLHAALDTIYTFGSAAEAPAGMPPAVVYRSLPSPSGSPMTEVVSVSLFDGMLYVIARYADGNVHHFYNGARITDWDGGANLPHEKGLVAFTHDRKVYSCARNLLFFSGVNTPTGWDYTDEAGGDAGAGYLNLSNHKEGAELLTSIGSYQSKLAVFAPNVVQLWVMNADPAQNYPAQTLLETGTRSPRAVRGFGNIDIFYLSDTGVRSLRAREATDIAGVQDVGTPIDPVIMDYMDTLTDDQIARACAVVDPRDSRFWLAIGARIFVFSYYPTKKISAWTWYEPGFPVDELLVFRKRIYVRSGNDVYLYGGDSGKEFDSCRVVAQLPFLTNDKPGHDKLVQGIDVTAHGTWDARVLLDPRDLNQYMSFGRLSGVTWLSEDTGGVGMSTHVAPRFVSEAPGPASLSQVGLHFQTGRTES